MSELDPNEVLERNLHSDPQATLFELEPAWQDHWWGMPDFAMADAEPRYRIVVSCMTLDDLLEFGKLIGVQLTSRSKSAQFPPEEKFDYGQVIWAEST